MEIFSNSHRLAQRPILTIASPYLGDNPSKWIKRLTKDKNANRIEIVIVDDGSNDDFLDAEICEAINNWPGPAKRIRLSQNIGRAGARNLAVDNAEGLYILFVDADMMPKSDDYLANYIDIIDRGAAAIAFGGFVTETDEMTHDLLLHHDLSMRADCLPAEKRAARGAYAVATNNLLVRADLAKKHRFDPMFKGWGWEDTEWAIRVVNDGYGLIHINNEAVHYGLDTSTTMLKKYKEAGRNLAVMLSKHDFANRYLSVKTAKLIGKTGIHKFLRPISQFIVEDKNQIFPVFARRMAIKFWRASWAAEALKEAKLI